MLRSPLVAFLGVYLMVTPALWPHQGAATALAILGGALVIVLALVGPMRPKALDAAGFVGFLILLSAFVVPDDMFTAADRGSVGAFIMTCAVFPSPRRLAPGERPH